MRWSYVTRNTSLFSVQELDAEMTRVTLKEVYEALEERGYNPTNQIVGYLISGDPGYISSYKECRNRILKFKREDILEIMLVDFIK